MPPVLLYNFQTRMAGFVDLKLNKDFGKRKSEINQLLAKYKTRIYSWENGTASQAQFPGNFPFYSKNPHLIFSVVLNFNQFFLQKGGVTQANQENSYYDGSLGVFVNMDNVDRDTGDYKYQRRPLFEWLARWLK